ncbi:MAG: LamG-like jellyroll fold domain-containing protein, partial [Candidatus Hydrogenedentales bacterium]
MRPTRTSVVAVCVLCFFLGSAAFAESPAEAPGCLLWLDASKVSGDSGSVATWGDSSGHGCDAAQPDANRQPASANGLLKFGGDDYLTVPLKRDWNGTDWTVFAVASLDADTPANYRGIIGNRFGEGSGTWWSLGTKGDGTLYLELAAGAGVTTSVLPANSTMCIYSVTKQGQQFSLYRNGMLMGTASYGDVGGLSNDLRIGMWFGDGQEWKGDIGEIILCDGAMSAPDRERIEQVLSEKWGVYFAQRLMIKESTWPATMLSSRKALRDWSAKQGITQLSDAAVLELWGVIEAEYPAEAIRFRQLAAEANRTLADWFRNDKDCEAEKAFIAVGGARLQAELAALTASNAPADDPSWLTLVNEAGETREAFQVCQRQLDGINVPALRRAIADLSASFPDRYARGQEFESRLNGLESRVPEIKAGLAACDETAMADANAILKLQQEALLSNPLLDFDTLLLVRRSAASPMLGLVQNWQSNCMLPHDGFDNEIALMSPVTPAGQVTTLYRPDRPVFVGDVDLNFDADRILFSSIGSLDRWQIFEIGADGTGLRQVTPGDEPDVDNYDPCYAPDERILFCSSAFFTAVPCVNGSSRCAVLYSMNADGS